MPKFKLAGMIFTVPEVRVMVAAPVLVVSAIEVAVIMTLASGGTLVGAAYVPLDAIVPQVCVHATAGLPWLKLHVTPWLLESLPTVAAKVVAFSAVIAFTGIRALGGEIETVIANTVIPIEPVLETSDTEVATIAIVVSLGTGEVGAV